MMVRWQCHRWLVGSGGSCRLPRARDWQWDVSGSLGGLGSFIVQAVLLNRTRVIRPASFAAGRGGYRLHR